MKKCVFLFLLPFALLTACKAKKEYTIKSKYYEVKKFRSSEKKDPIIAGTFKEYGTNIPIASGAVKLVYNEIISKGDTHGNYKFAIKPGRYSFIGVGYPYPPKKTEKIALIKGDSVRLNFYLPHDTTILFDRKIR